MRYIAGVLEASRSPAMEQLSVGTLPRHGHNPVSEPVTPLWRRVKGYVIAVVGVAVLTLACSLLTPLTGYGAISLIYLLGVLLAGMVLRRGPVLLVAGLSAVCWNFLFIPPLFTLHIAKLEDALTFATYFIIAITVGGLTAQLKAREQLAAKVQLAEESERLRKTLLDCVSHELKTPIAAIGAASQELLRMSADSPNALRQQLADEINDGSRRLNRVVNNLLDMNRLESGVIQPKQEWCEVRELLQSAVEIERETMEGREVTLHVPENIPLALVDYTLIEQAVAKLLANAGSHTPPNLPVEVEVQYQQDHLLIAVSDRGPGISEETAALLFEKFFRGNSRKAGGLGLGLSIARGFVEAHGGTLTAENCPGGGARFTIRLPIRPADVLAFNVSS